MTRSADAISDCTGALLTKGERTAVVSLVPSLTETVAQCFGADRLVGITPFCVEPEHLLRTKRQVGGPKNVDIDAITALSPDLVLACREENTAPDVAKLRDAGLQVYVARVQKLDQVLTLLEHLVALLGPAKRANRLLDQLCEKIASGPKELPGNPKVLCPVWPDPFMVLGHGTYGADLLRRSGFDLATSQGGYPVEDPAELDPHIILLPDEPYPFEAGQVETLGLGHTRAARRGRVQLIDGKTLFWYGYRSGKALEVLSEAVKK